MLLNHHYAHSAFKQPVTDIAAGFLLFVTIQIMAMQDCADLV